MGEGDVARHFLASGANSSCARSCAQFAPLHEIRVSLSPPSPSAPLPVLRDSALIPFPIPSARQLIASPLNSVGPEALLRPI